MRPNTRQSARGSVFPGIIRRRSAFWRKFLDFRKDRRQTDLREESLRLLILRMHQVRNERRAAEGLEMPTAARGWENPGRRVSRSL
jgi:hypothetical protein